MEVGAKTDVGLRKSHNEDSYEVWFATIDGQERGFFAVADGVGGEEKGEVASKEALSFIFNRFYPILSAPEKPSEDHIMELLEESIKDANTEIISITHERSIGKMATTLTMVVMLGQFLAVANVGDSRTYILRNHRLHRLTKDHSLIEHLVEKGKLTKEDVEVPRSERARMHENVVTRVLGDKETVDVDLYVAYLSKGDEILLCCDGLTDLVTYDEISDILNSSGTPNERCKELVRSANEEGGKDNITVVIVKPDELPSLEDMMKRKTVVKLDDE